MTISSLLFSIYGEISTIQNPKETFNQRNFALDQGYYVVSLAEENYK